MTVLTWRHVTLKQLDELADAKSVPDKLRLLHGIFGLKEGEEQSAILADLYYYALLFAEESAFTPEQTSTLLSILKEVHEQVVNTPYPCLDKDFTHFKALLLRHAVQRPPFSQRIFTLPEMECVLAYVRDTYFRHYGMYKYAFTKKWKLNLVLKDAVAVEAAAREAKAAAEATAIAAAAAAAAVEVATVQQVSAPSGDPAALGTEQGRLPTAASGAGARLTSAVSGGGAERSGKSTTFGAEGPTINEGASGRLTTAPGTAGGRQPTAPGTAGAAGVTRASAPFTPAVEPAAVSGPSPLPSPEDQAVEDLRQLILTSMAPHLEELKSSLYNKFSAGDELVTSGIKRLDLGDAGGLEGSGAGTGLPGKQKGGPKGGK